MTLFNDTDLFMPGIPVSNTNTIDNQPTKDLFEFISKEYSHNSDLGLFSLLPEAQGDDYEEEQFANEMKKKKNAIQDNEGNHVISVFGLYILLNKKKNGFFILKYETLNTILLYLHFASKLKKFYEQN